MEGVDGPALEQSTQNMEDDRDDFERSKSSSNVEVKCKVATRAYHSLYNNDLLVDEKDGQVCKEKSEVSRRHSPGRPRKYTGTSSKVTRRLVHLIIRRTIVFLGQKRVNISLVSLFVL